jgi:broad specificity phosphatase PhoE
VHRRGLPIELVLIRPPNRMEPHDDSIPIRLTALGREQAAALAAHLRSLPFAAHAAARSTRA